MATYDDPYNPIPRRLREPTPGYSQTRLPGTERTVVETPRGGFSPDPAAGLSERDLAPENYAMPFSPTRSMRYGAGDERDLGAPVVDPRDPLAPSPATWSGVVPRGSGRAAYSTNGGYAYTDAPAVPDQSTPRPLFSGVAGEDFEATRRRGEQVARLMRETDGPFANPNDWNYVRSYGPRAAAQAVASGRANISGAPPELVAQERERFLRNRTTDLSISPQLRSAARDELAQIEREAAEERRREMWAEEQAGLTERARIAATTGGAADNSWRTAVARIEQETQLRVKELENQGLDRRQAQEIAARERVQKLQNEGNLSVAQAQAQGRTDAATASAQGRVDAAAASAQGRVDAAAATAEGRVKAAGIRADAQKYASDNSYRAAADAATARVEAAKAAGLSDQQVAQIRTQSEERIAKLSQDGALARAGIQADAQKYIADNRYAAAADAAAAAVMAAEAGAGAKVEAERIRAEAQRLFAQENPWQAIGGGVMGNRQTGETAGTPNAAGGGGAKTQLFKMKGAGGAEALVSVGPDGRAQVVFEDPEAAEAIVEQEIRNLKSDKLRYGFTPQQIEGYDAQIAEAEARLKALREARRSAPDFEGAPPAGTAPTNNADDGWTAFGGIVR